MSCIIRKLMIFVTSVSFFCISRSAEAAGLTEGLLVEAQVTQGSNVLGGRVLIEAGRTEWTTIAAAPARAKKSRLRLEARAVLLETDVVEVETRVTGGLEQTGKLIVRLGESGVMTSSQMEKAEPAADSASNAAPVETSIGVKVLRVRYSL